MTSQVQIVGSPAPKTWDDFERGCLTTFGGGYRHGPDIAIFQHGMSTVFNLLRNEFPDAPLAKSAPELLTALKAIVDRDLTYLSGKVMGDQIAYAEVQAAREAIKKAEGSTHDG